MRYEDFNLIDTTPSKSPEKQWWTFRHKSNPNVVEVVFQYATGKVTGAEELIRLLKDNNIIENFAYAPGKHFKREYEDKVNRAQTGLQMGYKGSGGISED